ncbi:hypothetical protein FQN51_002641 [Onygenales sp. PD_10]|nr:hypothetical protein FQN51_002641 [Onygenales sp. PD_10]
MPMAKEKKATKKSQPNSTAADYYAEQNPVHTHTHTQNHGEGYRHYYYSPSMNDRDGRNNDTDAGGGRDVADQITPSRHSHRHIDCEAEPGLESTNRTAGFTSSKRKLARDPEEDGDEYNYDYDTPKGPSNSATRDTPTHSLGVPTPQYAKGTAKSSPKRIRSNEWLLRSREASPGHTAGGMKDSTPRLRSRRRQSAGKSSATYHHHGSRSVSGFISPSSADGERRSRFLEGSMNDRVSQKPPSIYIGDDVEDALDRYVTGDEGESGDNRGGSVSTTGTGSRYGHAHSGSIANSMSSVATDTPSAKSGLVRFGQAIASAFNPFGVWSNVSDIWSGPQDGTKASTATVSSTDILDERRAQAEKAYAELKAAGYKGTVKTVSANHSGGGGGGGAVTPSGKEKKVKVVKKQQSMITTPHKHNRSISSTFSKENLLTPSKSAIRASFQDLRKAASYINISTPSLVSKRGGRESVDDDRDAPDADSSILRKQASRKELEKQKKLRKKVSNLESRLEKARKELNRVSGDGSEVGDGNGFGNGTGNGIRDAEMAWNEHVKACEEEREEKESIAPIPPPHTSGLHTGVVRKKKFVPGALPSLPSERVLLGQAAAEENPTNRAMFNKGAVDHQRLRKGRREVSQDLTAASRHGGDKYSTARISGGRGGDGEKYPDASVGASTASKHGTARKGKLQRPAPSLVKAEDTTNTILPPNKSTDIDNENENDNENETYNPHPKPIQNAKKAKSPRRRRSSTTFPPENEDPLVSKSKSNRTHSHNHSTGTGADEEDMMMMNVEDVPPVPPLPANFVAGSNSRRRREMGVKMMGVEEVGRKGVGDGSGGRLRRVGKEGMKGKENGGGGESGFDWPEDFL